MIVLTAALLMCSFKVSWQHFNAALPTLSVPELLTSIAIGTIPAIFITPLGFLAGPIVVYALSPIWRKPIRGKSGGPNT